MRKKAVKGKAYKKKFEYSARTSKPSNYASGMKRGGIYKQVQKGKVIKKVIKKVNYEYLLIKKLLKN